MSDQEHATTEITEETIRALLAEAGEAGDYVQVVLCLEALDEDDGRFDDVARVGRDVALAECKRVIRTARTMVLGPYRILREDGGSAGPPTPEDLLAWRKAEGLTQTEAGEVADIREDVQATSKRRQWQRWENGEEPPPQWLREVLLQRRGSAP